jgi:hypothetical protein
MKQFYKKELAHCYWIIYLHTLLPSLLLSDPVNGSGDIEGNAFKYSTIAMRALCVSARPILPLVDAKYKLL